MQINNAFLENLLMIQGHNQLNMGTGVTVD